MRVLIVPSNSSILRNNGLKSTMEDVYYCEVINYNITNKIIKPYMEVQPMDTMTRMKYIRIIDKMNKCPVMGWKLGLKDISYIKLKEGPVRKGRQS